MAEPTHNLRMTRQRRLILDVLDGNRSHPTASEVYDAVRRQLPHISLGTVYRNLEVLSDAGLIHKLEVGGGQRRYDSDTAGHCHVRCTACGRIEDVDCEELHDVARAVEAASRFDVRGHRIEVVGLCPKCRKKAGKAAGVAR